MLVDKEAMICNNEKSLENIRESNEIHMKTLKRASDYENVKDMFFYFLI